MTKPTTDCECTEPGWCPRHGCRKSAHWQRLCRTQADYFRLWEQGRGPGQEPAPTVRTAVENTEKEVPPIDSHGEYHLAPLRETHVSQRPWEGDCRRKPWHYDINAVIPVMDTWEILEVVVELLRLQSVHPFITIIDTGSQPENYRKIESLRAQDVEVHSLCLNGVLHPSDFPAMAMDLAFSLCRSPYLFATHADCFLRNRTLLAEMLELCQTQSPVVGYEISPRQHEDWQGMFGHTCTMFEMQTMDRIGAGWSMRRLVTLFDIDSHEPSWERPNWPDTELLLNYLVRQNDITPHLIGHEENFVRHLDENIDHCRTLTGAMLYNAEHYAKASAWADDAMREAQARIKLWSNGHAANGANGVLAGQGHGQ